MKKLIEKIRDSHDALYKAFLFLASVVFLVYLFPKEVKFKYEFQKQKPWLYEDLIAPFDIPVLKSEDERQSEIDSLKNSNFQYYRWDASINDKAITFFNEELTNSFDSIYDQNKNVLGKILKINSDVNKKEVFDKHQKLGKQIIQNLYSRGIVQYSDHWALLNDNDILHVLKGNLEVEYNKGDFLTSKGAYKSIESSISKNEGFYQEYLIEILSNVLVKFSANIFYDAKWTQKVLAEKEHSLERVQGIIETGELIILKGERITDEKFKLLNSYKTKMLQRSSTSADQYWILVGQILLVSVVILGLAMYLVHFRPKIYEFNKNLVFILIQINVAVFLTSIILRFGISVYLIPFCLVPMVVRAFFDTRTALFTHLTAIILCGFLVPNSFEFLFVQFIAGIGALFGFVDLRNRAQLFITSSVVFICYAITYFGFIIIQEGNIENVNWIQFAWLAGGAGLTLFAYPFIYIYEKAFGLVSDLTLLELADTNNPLLRELSLKAPGTFQHSLQVANLAEAAIYQINGNSLLVRTGALYHDIGKMVSPRYFIENQGTGINPHDELSYYESADIIIGHVSEGVKIAKKYRLPDQIVDFIRTHHGTSMTQYFYRMSLKDEGEKVEKELFTYPGPIPYSKETAVLMMADSVEAASRSLKEHNAQNISDLVDNIINSQMNEGQFANADITMKDISLIKKLFKKMLMNIYHVRVEYPR